MHFVKMHAAGNDYVYIDARVTPVNDPAALARKVSDRHKGVGSDGLVLILPSHRAHARMRMFNADGSESEMCGNAIRCVGKYIYEHDHMQESCVRVETAAGIKFLELHAHEGKVHSVTVDMGEPRWKPADIPVQQEGEDCLALPLSVPLGASECRLTATCLSMGNPHAVIFCHECGLELDSLPLRELGPALERHKLFPRRTNVEFISVVDRNTLRMRVWERGAGETQACGTGACAAAVAAARLGHAGRTVTVRLPGGDLGIEWREDNHVFMTGEAVAVFEGRLF